MSYDPDQRITRKHAAVLARTTEKTLLRDERDRGLLRQDDPQTKQATYRLGDLVESGRIRLEDVTITGNAAEAAEVIKSRESLTKLRELVAEKDGRLSHADRLVATLTEQLAVKDRQITAQATQINKLSDTIQCLGGAKSLTADLAAKALGRPPARLSVRVHAALTTRRRP